MIRSVPRPEFVFKILHSYTKCPDPFTELDTRR